jgi:hypothetical protein
LENFQSGFGLSTVLGHCDKAVPNSNSWYGRMFGLPVYNKLFSSNILFFIALSPETFPAQSLPLFP